MTFSIPGGDSTSMTKVAERSWSSSSSVTLFCLFLETSAFHDSAPINSVSPCMPLPPPPLPIPAASRDKRPFFLLFLRTFFKKRSINKQMNKTEGNCAFPFTRLSARVLPLEHAAHELVAHQAAALKVGPRFDALLGLIIMRGSVF